jgi:hypothetical protein
MRRVKKTAPTGPVAAGWKPWTPTEALCGICPCRAPGAFTDGRAIRCAACVPREPPRDLRELQDRHADDGPMLASSGIPRRRRRRAGQD